MRTRNVSLVSLAAWILAASARAGGIRILDAGLGYPSFSTYAHVPSHRDGA